MAASQSRLVWHRFRKNRLSLVGVTIIIMFVIVALMANWISPYDPLKINLDARFQLPSLQHPFGTDELGRDIMSRIFYGARLTLRIGVQAITLAFIVGLTIGAIAGYYGGWSGNLIMRFMDMLLSFPPILLAIVIVTALGPGLDNAAWAIAGSEIPFFARLMNGMIISVKEQEYVVAAKMVGAGNTRILFRHLVPNSMSPMIVQYTIGVANAILIGATLGFLGLGAQPPLPEWGAMISGGSEFIQVAPFLTLFPGLAIVFAVVAMNMIGDGLRDALDPRM